MRGRDRKRHQTIHTHTHTHITHTHTHTHTHTNTHFHTFMLSLDWQTTHLKQPLWKMTPLTWRPRQQDVRRHSKRNGSHTHTKKGGGSAGFQNFPPAGNVDPHMDPEQRVHKPTHKHKGYLCPAAPRSCANHSATQRTAITSHSGTDANSPSGGCRWRRPPCCTCGVAQRSQGSACHRADRAKDDNANSKKKRR
jgi:hypothetical protein